MPTVGFVDLLGYAAAALVFLAFSLRSLVALRAVAVLSNVLFIGYAGAAGLPPVLLLHAALLPVNVLRLWQCRRASKPARAVVRRRAVLHAWTCVACAKRVPLRTA